MNSEQQTIYATAQQRWRVDLSAAAALLLILLAAHGWSLGDGIFFDDHWHRAMLRDCGWGLNELVESATIDVSGEPNHLWWQERSMVWRYARPVAMFFMGIEYHLAGGNPIGIHAFGLLWHGLTGLLTYRLARWAGITSRWSFLAAVMFIIHPHSVFTVGWTAARNAVISGFFFVAAVLAYARASVGGEQRPLRRLALPLLLWGLALLSRESAIVFPLVILVLDASFGGWRHLRRRLPFHALVWAASLVFVCWRLAAFSVEAAPQIYFHRPDGIAYLPWAVSKLVHLLFSLIFHAPMLMGLVTYEGLLPEHLLSHAIMAVMVGAVALWYVLASRGHRGRWVWPAWVVAAFLPVVPVFVMPQFAYLPAIAQGILAAVILSSLGGRWRPVVTALVIAATLWSLAVYRLVWRGVIRSEQLVYADIRYPRPAPEPDSQVFFINLPIAAIYAPLALREAWGLDDLEGHTLTFAPHPLIMNCSSVVEQLNEHELVVSTGRPGYFSGMPGRMLLDGTRPGSPLAAGTVVQGELFDTTVVEADEAGVYKLKFSFREPLASPRYYFYVSSPQRPAQRLRFDVLPSSMPAGDADLFTRAKSDDPQTFTPAREEIVARARPLAVQTAGSIQLDLAHDPQLRSDEALARVENWWRAVGASQLERETDRWRKTNARMLAERNRYFRIMDIVKRVVRSDLFLTGGEAGR